MLTLFVLKLWSFLGYCKVNLRAKVNAADLNINAICAQTLNLCDYFREVSFRKYIHIITSVWVMLEATLCGKEMNRSIFRSIPDKVQKQLGAQLETRLKWQFISELNLEQSEQSELYVRALPRRLSETLHKMLPRMLTKILPKTPLENAPPPNLPEIPLKRFPNCCWK